MLDRDIYNNDFVPIEKKEPLELIDEYDPYREIDELCAKLNRIKYSMLEEASLADMGRVVESSKERPIIGTQALDTCYGILFYDRVARKGLVGHGSPSGKIGTLYEMIGRLDDGTEKVVEFAIVPGFRNVNRGDLSGFMELQRELAENCPANISFIPFKGDLQVKLHEPTLTYEFGFDTRNGMSVSESIFFDEVEVNPRYKSHSKGRFGK